MRKLILAGSTVVMMAAMGMTAFAANTVSAPSAGPGSYAYCAYLDDDGDGICDNCANEQAHCGHEGHVGACSDVDGRGYYRDDCNGTHRDGCGHSRSVNSSSSRTGSGRRGHHGGCH